ncbi:MAG TPA: MbnP family copper-binding protein [Polyangiaceae bacterium]|jgi:uncharacterized repeat protein (TIGR04052 family)|nr:MbnP family copper-binding protein [Polyangiaceae bacterium]
MPKMTLALRSAVLTSLGFTLLTACSDDDSPSGSPEAGVTEDGGASSSGGSSGKSGSGGKIGAGGATSAGGAVATGGTTATAGARAIDGGTAGSRDDDAGLVDAGPMQVTLRFKATVGAKPFACGTTYDGQGKTKVAVEPRDFRFYVQDVRLVGEHGADVPVALATRSPWQTPDVALLDFEDGTGTCVDGNADTNDVITGTVPRGKYTGVVFVNGIPDGLNHGDPLHLPAPLQVGTMTWGWLFGFKFVKAELGAVATPGGDAEPGLGLIHLGSTGCNNVDDGGMPNFGAPPTVACTQANRNEVRLDGFDPGVNSVVADLGALFAGTDLSVNNQCHSEGDSCSTEFAALGLDYTTGAHTTTQSVYRVE